MSCVNKVCAVAFEAVAQLICFREFTGSNLFAIIGCPVKFIVV